MDEEINEDDVATVRDAVFHALAGMQRVHTHAAYYGLLGAFFMCYSFTHDEYDGFMHDALEEVLAKFLHLE